jgi:DNA-binding HxlR family transcriptional regulator
MPSKVYSFIPTSDRPLTHVLKEDASFLIPSSSPMHVAGGAVHAKRLLALANCLTSDQPGGVLAMFEAGPTSLDELADSLPAGTSRDRLVVLLRELRDAGFVWRSTEAGPPLRVSYGLTGDGQKLLDVTAFLSTWLSDKDQGESAARFWSSLRTTPVVAAS